MKRIIASLAICLMSISSAQSAIIFFDDFGSGGNTGNISSSTPNVSTLLPNWTIESGNLDLWNFSGFAGWSVDMGGSASNASILSVDSFTFDSSKTYTISFLLGNNRHTSPDNGLDWGLEFNNAVIEGFSITDLNSLSQSISQMISYTFTPTDTFEARLYFTATGLADFGGAILDDVKIESVHVPAPAAIGLLGLALLAMRRFKKS